VPSYQRARRADRRRVQRLQDVELALQVVGRQQSRLGRPDPDDDVLTDLGVALAPRDRQQQRFGDVAEFDADESLDPHVVGFGEQRREPRRQLGLDVVVHRPTRTRPRTCRRSGGSSSRRRRERADVVDRHGFPSSGAECC
jgi:hypothetical protein